MNEFLIAIERKDKEKLKILFEEGLDPNSKISDSALSPDEAQATHYLLHVVCSHGDVDSMKVLIDAGANINQRDERGCTALHVAYDSNCLALVEELLTRGADPSMKDQDGRLPGDCFYDGQVIGNSEINKEDAWAMNVLHAVSGRFISKLKDLLDTKGPNAANLATSNQMTPLLTCSVKGGIEVLNVLLEYGADPFVTGPGGYTPMHFAAQGGHTDIAKRLIEVGVDPNVTDNQGMTPLMISCLFGQIEIVQLLLPLKVKGKDSCTGKHSPLHFACRGGHIPVVNLLLGHPDFLMNEGGDEGITPLMIAAASGHTALVDDLLVKHSADSSLTTTSGKKAGDFFAEGVTQDQRLLVLKLLGRSVESEQTSVPSSQQISLDLWSYCGDGDLPAVHAKIKEGANVNYASPEGLTPLHVASLHQHPEVVEDLLKASANPNVKNCDGMTPLYIAASQGPLTIVKLLVESGADLNVQEANGITSLNSACMRGMADIAWYLLARGADKMIPDSEGNLPGDFFIDSLHEEEKCAIKSILAAGSHNKHQPWKSTVFLLFLAAMLSGIYIVKSKRV